MEEKKKACYYSLKTELKQALSSVAGQVPFMFGFHYLKMLN